VLLSRCVVTKVQLHNLFWTQRGKCIGFARIIAKLNLKNTLRPFLNNRSYLAPAQTF
jgi:hypothetical protein